MRHIQHFMLIVQRHLLEFALLLPNLLEFFLLLSISFNCVTMIFFFEESVLYRYVCGVSSLENYFGRMLNARVTI